LKQKAASCVAGPGTTTPGTAGLVIVTGTSQLTAMTTLVPGLLLPLAQLIESRLQMC